MYIFIASANSVTWKPLRLFDILVSVHADDFLSNGAYYCVRNVTAGGAEVSFIKCVQQIRGQYETIHNLVHYDYNWFLFANTLSLCEVKIFANGKKNLYKPQ